LPLKAASYRERSSLIVGAVLTKLIAQAEIAT